MELTVIFDLIIDVIVFFQDTFDSLKVTIFDKSISFVDIICVALVYKLINFIIHGDDD